MYSALYETRETLAGAGKGADAKGTNLLPDFIDVLAVLLHLVCSLCEESDFVLIGLDFFDEPVESQESGQRRRAGSKG